MLRDLYRFYLVDQEASGYVPFDHGELTGFPGRSVKVVEDAARDLIHERLDLHPVQEISAKDSLIIEFEQHQYLVFFEKTGPSYECLVAFRVLVPPHTDETVGEIAKRMIRDHPRSGQDKIFRIYQSNENHENLETKLPAQVEVEIPLNDGYLYTNAAFCTPQTFLKRLESNTLIIVIDDQGYESRERSLEPTHEDLTVERWEIAEAARNRKSPSEDAKPSEVCMAQVSDRVDAVYNGRPMNLIAPPIQIYHPVFEKFLSRAFLPFDGDHGTLQRTSMFMEAACRCYNDEVARTVVLRPLLADLVHKHILNPMLITLDDNKRMQPDATIFANRNWGSMRPVCAFFEGKNEVGTGGCDPILQCQSDFVKLYSSSVYQPIVNASYCPVLLLAMAGPTLMVAGAVFANTFIAQRLTDRLALDPHPTDHDGGLRRVAQVFVAIRECIQDLDSFYSNLKFDQRKLDTHRKERVTKLTPSQGPRAQWSQGTGQTAGYVPESPLGRWVFPYRTEFKFDDKAFSLAYDHPLEGRADATRCLLTASMQSSDQAGELVVVKFARRYCPEAHKLLAEMSLAPKLLYHEDTVGVHFVVMEYAKATKVTGEELKKPEHVQSLRTAVQALHGNGLVFGDLRGPNILIVEDGVRLVDFDWSGKEGVVRYPSHISMEIEWPEGVKSGGKIEVEHDKEWFKRLTGTEL